MYERSAIVLEKYFNNMFGFNQKINLKSIYKGYSEMIDGIKKYQDIIKSEDNIINEFDKAANEISNIQQEQKKIYELNVKLEEERNQLFNNLDEDPELIRNKIKKIEEKVNKNNNRQEELRDSFIQAVTEFSEKQKERNKCSKNRRTEEKSYMQIIEKISKDINEIEIETLKRLKELIDSESETNKNEILEILINNGKDERVPFDGQAMEIAVNARNEIAKKEAACYMVIYEKTKKLLIDINNDDIKLDKYEKKLRDMSVKLAYLKAQRNYIVSFLDNERIVAINGSKIHQQLMAEACKNFELDMIQFDNLYNLILREIANKSTKKAYNELYNREYLTNIEEKQKNFEKETTNIKIKSGAIINFNYWRIEEIKNIYEIFGNEISEKFNKDLSEFKLEPIKEVEELKPEIEEEIEEDNIFKTEISEDDVEYVEEYEYDEDEEYEIDDENTEDEYLNYEDTEDDENDNEEDYQENYEEDNDEEEFEFDDEYEEEYDFEDFEDEEETENISNTKKKKGLFNKLFKDKK